MTEPLPPHQQAPQVHPAAHPHWNPGQQAAWAPAPVPVPKPKPRISKLSWFSLGASGLAGLFWLISNFTPRPAPQCTTRECWAALADVPQTIFFADVFGWFVAPLLLTAFGLGIAGLVRSEKKRWPLVALAVPVLMVLLPALLIFLGFMLWFVMGASSQLLGGPVVG